MGGACACCESPQPLPLHCQYTYTCAANNSLGVDAANISVHEGGECTHRHTHLHRHMPAAVCMCVRWSADKRLLHTARSGVCVYPNNPEWVHVNYIHGI